MAKTKRDVRIDGVIYKDIQVSEYAGKFDIDTAGVAQIMRQYVKNKYGNIKVWARINKFAGGSSVGVDLWNVPNDWYNDINTFADRFGMSNVSDGYGGDGYWRGSQVGATLIDGQPVGNYSPYMSVSNTPPWDAKERDMTPPDYSKSLPEKSNSGAKKGFKKFGEKKTEGFALVKSCGNGWNLFLKKEENSEKPYNYRLIKNYAVKPVGKEQFYALKGDMLEVGFLWSVKAQCLEYSRFNEIPESTIKNACGVLSKYFPITETIPTEDLPPPPTESTTKVPIKSITLVYEDALYTTFKEVDDYFKFLYENESKLQQRGEGYDKYKIKFTWKDGSYITDRLDIAAYGNGNFNPFRESLSDYYKKLTDGTKEYTAYYDGDINTELKNLSFEDLEKTQTSDSTQEVNLEQLIGDMNILIDLETDNDKRMELAGYRNDLQILLSLNN